MKELSKRLHPINRFTIKRSQWLRGTDAGWLRNKSRKQCCLGFCARELGFSATEIQGLELISTLFESEDQCNNYLKGYNRRLESDLVSVNDSPLGNEVHVNTEWRAYLLKTDAQRERIIKRLFKTIGVKVIFVD